MASKVASLALSGSALPSMHAICATASSTSSSNVFSPSLIKQLCLRGFSLFSPSCNPTAAATAAAATASNASFCSSVRAAAPLPRHGGAGGCAGSLLKMPQVRAALPTCPMAPASAAAAAAAASSCLRSSALSCHPTAAASGTSAGRLLEIARQMLAILGAGAAVTAASDSLPSGHVYASERSSTAAAAAASASAVDIPHATRPHRHSASSRLFSSPSFALPAAHWTSKPLPSHPIAPPHLPSLTPPSNAPMSAPSPSPSPSPIPSPFALRRPLSPPFSASLPLSSLPPPSFQRVSSSSSDLSPHSLPLPACHPFPPLHPTSCHAALLQQQQQHQQMEGQRGAAEVSQEERADVKAERGDAGSGGGSGASVSSVAGAADDGGGRRRVGVVGRAEKAEGQVGGVAALNEKESEWKGDEVGVMISSSVVGGGQGREGEGSKQLGVGSWQLMVSPVMGDMEEERGRGVESDKIECGKKRAHEGAHEEQAEKSAAAEIEGRGGSERDVMHMEWSKLGRGTVRDDEKKKQREAAGKGEMDSGSSSRGSSRRGSKESVQGAGESWIMAGSRGAGSSWWDADVTQLSGLIADVIHETNPMDGIDLPASIPSLPPASSNSFSTSLPLGRRRHSLDSAGQSSSPSASKAKLPGACPGEKRKLLRTCSDSDRRLPAGTISLPTAAAAAIAAGGNPVTGISGASSASHLGEALCRSQTRARLAEAAAELAEAEKQRVLQLLMDESALVFVYRRWALMLQCQNARLETTVFQASPCSCKVSQDLSQSHGICLHGVKVSPLTLSSVSDATLHLALLAFALGIGLAGAALFVGYQLGVIVITSTPL